MDFPFKGDETPLRHMEHAELISIGTVNGKLLRILHPGAPLTLCHIQDGRRRSDRASPCTSMSLSE